MAVAQTNAGYPRTNDASVTANVIGIAPQIQGPIVKLNVVDNQPVNKGDLLFVIDPRPYEVELQRAQGELILAQAQVSAMKQAIAADRAQVAQLRAEMAYADAHANRLRSLTTDNDISADQYQQAATQARSLADSVQHAESQLREQEELLAQDGDVNGRLEVARAAIRLARLNVEYCFVRAPFNGLVTNFNIAVGDYAHVGQSVFALVDRQTWYVLANFPETLLPAIKPGMQAQVSLVAYPGRTFEGVVQGIAWGASSPAGQTAELLPRMDPPLNCARPAQRIPVRIILHAPPAGTPFRMGMTAAVTITGLPRNGKPLSVPGKPIASAQ